MNIDEAEGVLLTSNVVTKLLNVLFSITLKNWQQQFSKNQAAKSEEFVLLHP